MFNPGAALYSQGFGTVPAGLAFPAYIASAPTSTTTQGPFGPFQIGQLIIVPNVGAWVLVGLSTVGGTLSAIWDQVVQSVIDSTGTTQQMLAGASYIADNAALLTFTLPAVAPQGSTLQVVGNGAGGWTIHQNAGQVINFNAASTTVGVGGSLSSSNRYNCVELMCTIANTAWTVMNNEGTLTVV
jgi:hypothetical protein